MATARCYSKSGNVEKYESYLWIDPSTSNWSSMDIVGKVTTPDSNGNYTVTPPSGYEDSNTPTEFYCHTMYGGVRKTFYFKNKIHVINLSCDIHLSGGGGSIKILLRFDDNKYLGNDKLFVEVTVSTISPNTTIDSGFFTVTKNSISPLSYSIDLGAEVGKKYVAKIIKCNPTSGDGYIVQYVQY